MEDISKLKDAIFAPLLNHIGQTLVSKALRTRNVDPEDLFIIRACANLSIDPNNSYGFVVKRIKPGPLDENSEKWLDKLAYRFLKSSCNFELHLTHIDDSLRELLAWWQKLGETARKPEEKAVRQAYRAARKTITSYLEEDVDAWWAKRQTRHDRACVLHIAFLVIKSRAYSFLAYPASIAAA